MNFAFVPIIVLRLNQDDNYYFQISPRYNVARTEAIGNYYGINADANAKTLIEKQVLNDIKQSLGIGIGIYIGLSEKNTGGISLNLNYNNNDFGSLISDLKHSSGKINTKDVFTLGINYYLGFQKKK